MGLKEGDRLIDTDGDAGTALNVRVVPEGQQFDMHYDKGFTARNMFFTPITEDEIELGFEVLP